MLIKGKILHSFNWKDKKGRPRSKLLHESAKLFQDSYIFLLGSPTADLLRRKLLATIA